MTTLNELTDVTISDPKAAQVLKYTAEGWVNATDAASSGAGGNPCGANDDNVKSDVAETITEPWNWSIGDAEYGVKVDHQDGVNSLDEYSALYPGRLTIGNKYGGGEFKTFDGGNTRLSAFENQLSFYDINNPEGVTLAELVACCDDGGGDTPTPRSGFMPAMVNFPTAGVFTHEQSPTAQSVYTPIDEANGVAYDARWVNRDFYDVFNADTTFQTVEMPAGTNAAVIFAAYPVQITSSSLVNDYDQGYANVSYNWEITTNKGTVTTGPGALAASVKLRTEIVGWRDAGQIGGGDTNIQSKRTPGLSVTGTKAVRCDFTESTAESPTRITITPRCSIQRTRACKTIIGSGRVIVMPYYDDGSGFDPVSLFAAAYQDSNDDPFYDDGGQEIAFEQATQSKALKNEMNYMSNAISETLNYDTALSAEGQTVLTKCLNDIFDLKRNEVDDIDYYYNQLETIRALALPYVGFKFGFETDDAVLSF
jgi:hypothetical protein